MTRKQVSFLLFATTLILVLLYASPPRLAAQASGNAQKQNSRPRPPAPAASTNGTGVKSGPQTANIPYFTLRDGMTSILTLNNSASTPTAVTVTIFNAEGRAQTLQPITLNPQSVKQLNLAELVPTESFDSGNVQVAFNGFPFEVNCQVSIFSLDKRVDIESRQQDNGHFESPNLNGIVSLPYFEAEGFLAVTSTATGKVTAEISVLARTKQIVLSPRETRLIDLGKELAVHPLSPALVQLKHNGMPGDIIAAGFALDLKNGYSSAFAMSDPAIEGSTTLAGAHFRAGQPDPSDGFSPGTQFRAPLILANVGTNPVTAHISVDYTVRQKLEMSPVDPKEASVTEDKFSTVFLKDLTITPGDVQQIELSDELARLDITGPLKEAGVDITYEGKPGDIIGQLTSVDQTGDYSFEVPIRDAAAKYKYVGGAYPWTLEGGTNTTLHLKNATSKKTYALVQFFFPDGRQFLPDRIVLQPHQTVALDIQRLKDSKQVDIRKHAFPGDATSGLLWWTEGALNSLVGGAEQLSIGKGFARGFSAGHPCLCPMQPMGIDMSPGSDTEDVGTVDTPFTPEVTYGYPEGCSSYEAGPYTPGNGSWSSDDSAVASVDPSSGQLTYDGAGSADIRFSWSEEGYESDGLECLDEGPLFYSVDAFAIGTPKITGISPAKGLIAATTSPVTISGRGFGTTTQTVSAGAGITVNVTSWSDMSIKANFVVGTSAPAGNHAVTVTAGGQTSNSVNFFVQVPTSMNALSDTQVISMSYCPGGGFSSSSYGIVIAIHYQVMDQNGAAVASSQMEPQEKDPDLGLNDWGDMGPSGYPASLKFTDTSGQFWDAPLGVCSGHAFTLTDTQSISMLINGTRYPASGAVRTNSWSTSSSSAGHGTVTNNNDVSKSR